MCQKLDQKLARSEWHCYPVLVNNSLGVYPKFHTNQLLGFTDLMYCQCKNTAVQIGMPRTPTFGVNLLIILKECNGMS